jgi:hypothetical protein
VADREEPPRPTLRDGRYVLLATLGEGAQARTWDAVDKREGRPVAIKQFDVRGARAWKEVELAEREARVLASLSHPKLPRYVEHFEEDGVLYLVMEKIEGAPLSKLRAAGTFGEEDVVRLLRDASDVLGYLHGRAPPVFHRDVKPSNVIRRPDGSFAFVDFGAVRERLRPKGGSTVVGTFGYMAPEQFQGRAGPGSDVYALGATALSLLTGEEPEDLPHRGLAIDVHAALGGRVSRRLEDVLARMLEPDPDKRPTAVGPLLAALDGRRARAGERSPRAPATQDWSRAADLGRELGREIRDRVEREVEDHVARATEAGDPLGARRAKRAERRQQRNARRAERDERRRVERAARRRQRRGRLPWFVVLPVFLALTVAQVAVLLTMRLVVPFVLVLLSLVFGRGLRAAAASVASAGDRARAAMTRAAGAIEGPDEEARVRVDESGGTGVRVAEAEETDEEEEQQEEEPRERGGRRS